MQEGIVVTIEEPLSLIHLILKKWIKEKSKRDKVNFTSCQLARALGMPRSMITKLTHPDKTKRVVNPRIDTLIKIVNFFKSDGFNITIADLIGSERKVIDINNTYVSIKKSFRTIPIYSLDNENGEELGTVDIKINSNSTDIFGLYTANDIKPFFKAGSVFIVDSNKPLKDGYLIAIKTTDEEDTKIKKYCIHNNKVKLQSLHENDSDIDLMPTSQSKIIGVIIQINAKT